MKKKLCLVLCIALAMLALIACGSSGNGLVGKWELQGQEGFCMEFTKGGEVKIDIPDGVDSYLSDVAEIIDLAETTYKVNSDSELEMKMSMFGETITHTFHYSLDGDKLTIENEEYTRK